MFLTKSQDQGRTSVGIRLPVIFLDEATRTVGNAGTIRLLTTSSKAPGHLKRTTNFVEPF